MIQTHLSRSQRLPVPLIITALLALCLQSALPAADFDLSGGGAFGATDTTSTLAGPPLTATVGGITLELTALRGVTHPLAIDPLIAGRVTILASGAGVLGSGARQIDGGTTTGDEVLVLTFSEPVCTSSVRLTLSNYQLLRDGIAIYLDDTATPVLEEPALEASMIDLGGGNRIIELSSFSGLPGSFWTLSLRAVDTRLDSDVNDSRFAAAGIQAAATATIGGNIYGGARDEWGPIYAPNALTPPLLDARVMVQNQHSGGQVITYGTITGNHWEASVPAPGDYVVMFVAPGYECTSREFIVDSADSQMKDAYLPPLPLPLANLLVYTFYDNAINGEFDDEDDAPLNGVTVRAWDADGNLLATGVTGTQGPIATTDRRIIVNSAGYYYFRDLPPGEIHVTSDPSTAYLYDVNGPMPLPTKNPVTATMFDFDATTEFYLLSSEEGSRNFEVVLYPGDPGTEEEGFLAWHGFVEKLDQITSSNVEERFGAGWSLGGAGTITGRLADADQGWVVEIVMAGEPPEEEEPEALVPPLHPGVSANTIVPDGLVILHTAMETTPGRAVATAEPDPVTGEFTFTNVPPARYRMFCCDVPIDYVYVQQQVTVGPGENVVVPDPAFLAETPGIMVPRFFARAQGFVKNNATDAPIPGAEVNIRLKDGSIWRTQITDSEGWYSFDDLPEVEVLAYVDVTLPDGFRGAIVTDTFHPNAVWLDPLCNPTADPACVELGDPYEVTHNAMNRYIQWYTANYRGDLLLEPIPASTGDIGGFVFYDHLAQGPWVGDGVYDEVAERTMHGVTVELWDATETTLIATTTTGKFDRAATLAQGWHEPYSFPIDEWGGVFVGPLPGYYEFRDLAPGEYRVRVLPPNGFLPAPAGSDVVTVSVDGGGRNDLDFGINTLAPLAGEIEGGVWDDVFIDPRPLSLMWLEKAGIDGAPVGVYDHLGYFLGAGYQGNPMCYTGAEVGPDPLTQCPPGEPLGQKPELERRFAPTPLLYLGNDPSLPGYNAEYLPLMMPYTMGQGQFKFEADWSLVPVAFGIGPTQMAFPPIPPASPPPIITMVQGVGNLTIAGAEFGPEQGFSTVTLSGREVPVTSWSDTEITVEALTDVISGPLIVTTLAGHTNAVHVDVPYDPARAAYLAERSVYVDAANDGFADGSEANPWSTIGEALLNLPMATPRYVFVAPGYYNERAQITESDIEIIGAGPLETIVDGLQAISIGGMGQGFAGTGPVFFIGRGGTTGSVVNILISGLTITRGSVNDDIGCGIFGDYGNRNIDINTCILDHNGGYYGGGIWLHKSNHDVRIWSNTISNNGNPGGYGGGISVNDEPYYGPHHGEPEHTIDDDIPGFPPGTYEIFNNHMYRNFSPDYGGAIALYEVKDHLIVAGNLIEANMAYDHGGGVFFEDTGPIDLYGNTIRRNSCLDDGGGVSFEDVGNNNATVRVFNNVIAENWADDHAENNSRGGGIAFDDTFYAEIFNNTIVGNVVAGSKDPAGGGIDIERNGHEYNGSEPLGRDMPPGFTDVRVYDNIIWGNMMLTYDQRQHSDEEDLDWRFGINHVWTPANIHVDDPAVQPESMSHLNFESLSHVEFNCLDAGEYSARRGNVVVDPQFVDPEGLDWRLSPGSPVSHLGAYAGEWSGPPGGRTVAPLVVPEVQGNAMCFGVNEVTVAAGGAEIAIRASLGADMPFDPVTDEVRLSVSDGGGHTVHWSIPPGSFSSIGGRSGDVFEYVGPAAGSSTDVSVLYEACSITIACTRVSIMGRPVGNAMAIGLQVGSYLGRESFPMLDTGGQYTYVRAVELDCCPVQPIAFSHSEHMEKRKRNIGCLDCHAGAATQDDAGLPGKDTCFGCHGGPGGGASQPTANPAGAAPPDGVEEGHDGEDERANDDHHDAGRSKAGDREHDKDERDREKDKKKHKRKREKKHKKKHEKKHEKKRDHEKDKDEEKKDEPHGRADKNEGNGGGGGADNEGQAELAPFRNSDLEIPWVKMAVIKAGFNFSHSLHVTGAQIDCLVCHPDQPTLRRPPSVIYRVMTMEECRSCHYDRGARYDCQACHQ